MKRRETAGGRHKREYLKFAEETLAEELAVVGAAGPWKSAMGGPEPEGATSPTEYRRALLALVRVGNAAWHRHRLSKRPRKAR